MCDYCKKSDELKEVARDKITLIGNAGSLALYNQVFIVNMPEPNNIPDPVIYTAIDVEGTTFSEIKIKINYCPFCGEKLRGDIIK